MKKILMGFLAIFTVFSLGMILSGASVNGTPQVALAEESVSSQPVDQTGNTRTLTIEDCLSLAEQNNYTLKVADISKQKAYLAAKDAKSTANALEDNASIANSNTLLAKYANEEIQENLRIIADKTYEVAKEQIILLVEKEYFAVLEKADLVKVNESTLERANKQLENATASFNVGTVAKTDVLAAQVGVAQAQANLTAAKNNLNSAMIDLNRTIGLDLNTVLNLTSKPDLEPAGEIDLDATVQAAMETRLDMASGNVTLENANLTYKTLQSYIPGTNSLKTYALGVETAQQSLDNTKSLVISDLTKAYLNINAAKETMDYLKAGVDQAQENMRLTNLRYEVGMATTYDVLDASVKQSDMESKYVSAQYAFNLAKLAFETDKVAPAN